jgi:hypothetical protein
MSSNASLKTVFILIVIGDTIVIGAISFEVDRIDTVVVIFIVAIVDILVAAILHQAESTGCVQL